MENRQRKKYKLGSGMSNWKGGQSYEVTFIVTEDCNLRCKYCYQVKKIIEMLCLLILQKSG